MSLCEIQHDDRPENTRRERIITKNPVRVQNANPGLFAGYHETRGTGNPHIRPAYTIPNPFYPSAALLSSTNPEEILPNANIFSGAEQPPPLTTPPDRDRISGQIKGSALPRSASPCENQRHKRIRGYGGIGRLGGFRCCHLCEGFSQLIIANWKLFCSKILSITFNFPLSTFN